MAIGRTMPHTTRVAQQGAMGYGLQAIAPIEAGRNMAAYLHTGLSYIVRNYSIHLAQPMHFKVS